MIARFRTATKAAALLALSFPQLATANTFTSATVLGWDSDQQDSYFQTSVGMVAIVAMQTGRHEDKVSCINNWYWPDGTTEHRPQNDSILEAMKGLPDVHPQAIIMAVIERECGRFSLS